MAYTPTTWVNEVPTGTPDRYLIKKADGTVIDAGATIDLVNPITPGTPVNAQNLNHLEQGLQAAAAMADTAEADAQTGITNAAAAQATANNALTAANNAAGQAVSVNFAGVSMANGHTLLAFTQAGYANLAMWSSANPTRIMAPVSGLYMAHVWIYRATLFNISTVAFWVNGSVPTQNYMIMDNSADKSVHAVIFYHLTAGQYFEFDFYQNTGSAQTISANVDVMLVHKD